MTNSAGGCWKIGLAEVCTTPDPPVWLYGYASPQRHRPFEGKLQDVYAKAMAIEDANGSRAVLITVDLCVLRAGEAAQLMDTGHELPSCYPAPLTVWQFDRDLTPVALCGETTSGYIAAVEAALGVDRLWVDGYTNQVFGYLPTSQLWPRAVMNELAWFMTPVSSRLRPNTWSFKPSNTLRVSLDGAPVTKHTRRGRQRIISL